MPQKDFQPGKGTKWEIGSPLQEITGIRQHSIPEIRHEQIEFTGNTDDGEEFVNSPLQMSNEFTLQINYAPGNTGHEFLIANVGTQQDMQVTTKKILAGAAAADGYVYTFRANIASVTKPSHGNNEAARLDVTFRPTGKITRAAAI
jgi:hypothetical protein